MTMYFFICRFRFVRSGLLTFNSGWRFFIPKYLNPDPGGTGYQPVLAGNLPARAGRLVACRNRPVACSTQKIIPR
jgi:hypothetical protein